MGRLRGSYLVTAFFGIAIVVMTSLTFLKYQPPIPDTSVSLDDIASGGSALPDSRNSPTDDAGRNSSLTSARVQRLQDVVRSQRAELMRLRSANRPTSTAATAKPAKPPKTGSLLSKLPDLALLTGGESDEEGRPTYEQLSERLGDLRDFAAELEEELRAAESVVEMQSAEIEGLQADVDEARERIASTADARDDLDTVVGRLLDESRDLEGVARQTLIRLGPPAAAMLLALEDQPPHVRSWITEILTKIDTDEPNSDSP